MTNYYDILGLDREASDIEIRKAYRRLARKHHPDVNADSGAAETEFKQINEAYQVLSDPERRRKYDKYGESWKQTGFAEDIRARSNSGQWPRNQSYSYWSSPYNKFGSHFNNMFSTFSSPREDKRRARSANHQVTITLEEAYEGTTRHINITNVSELNPTRRLEVTIPPGVDNNSKVHIPYGDNPQEDLYLRIAVQPHARFQRQGNDLKVELDVSLTDAVLGNEIVVTTLNREIALKIPAETQNGQTFRLVGQGMPLLHNTKDYGDLMVKVTVTLPQRLSEEERKIFQQLKELLTLGR